MHLIFLENFFCSFTYLNHCEMNTQQAGFYSHGGCDFIAINDKYREVN